MRFWRRIGVPGVGVAGLLLAAAPGGAQSLHVTDDATVDAGVPAKNQGRATTCDVGTGKRCFLRFDLSLLPPGTSGLNVAKATLVLHVGRVSAEGFIRVAPVDGAWSEGTVTESTAPFVFVDADATRFREISLGDSGTFITIDVTEYLFFALAFGPDFGIAIDQPGAAIADPRPVDLQFDTKENTRTSHPAEIQVFLTGFDD